MAPINCPSCGQALAAEGLCSSCGSAARASGRYSVASIAAIASGLAMLVGGYVITATGAFTTWAWNYYRTERGSVIGSFAVIFSHEIGNWLSGLGVVVVLIGAFGLWRARRQQRLS